MCRSPIVLALLLGTASCWTPMHSVDEWTECVLSMSRLPGADVSAVNFGHLAIREDLPLEPSD